MTPLPLQGKVTLEPAPSVAKRSATTGPGPAAGRGELRASGRAGRAHRGGTRAYRQARRRHRLLAWGLGGVGLLSLGQFGAFLVDQFAASPSGAGPGCSPPGLVAVGTAGVAGREWLRLRTWKRRQDVRSRAEDLLAHRGWVRGRPSARSWPRRAVTRGGKGIAPGYPSLTRATAIGKC